MVSANGKERELCKPEIVVEEIHQNSSKHREDPHPCNGNNSQEIISENGKKMDSDQMRLQFASICEVWI
mgnify:FL=1